MDAILHKEYRRKLERLEPEQQLAVIYAMMDYADGSDPELTDPVAAMAFEFIKDRIDADIDKYEKHIQNGSKGGRPKKTEPNETEQNRTEPNETEQNRTKAIESEEKRTEATESEKSILISKSKSILISNDKEKTSKEKAPTGAARFVRPTLEEVEAYCRERGNSISAQGFLNYYDSNGWRVGKSPMKDWKAAVRTWEQRDKKTVEPEHHARAQNRFHNFEERKIDYDAILAQEMAKEALA